MATQPTPKPEGFLASLLNAASPAGADGRPSDIIEGPKQLLTHPIESLKTLAGGISDSANSELQQSKDALANKDYPRAGLHGLGYAVPFLGPLVAKAGEQAIAHNFAGSAGTTLGIVAPLVGGEFLAGEHPTIGQQALSEHTASGGSTFDPRTGQNLSGSRNIAVGISPETAQVRAKAFTPEEYNSFVGEHRDLLQKNPNAAVGTSVDASGMHRMEVVGTTSSKAAAQALAQHLGEDHAYNLATDEKIPAGSNGDWQPSPLTTEQRLKELAARTPSKDTYSGTHFSDAKVDMIDGSRRGSTGASSEAQRLRLGSQSGLGPDAPGGFYSYQAGTIPDAPMAAKKNAYQIRGRLAFASTDHPEFQQGYATGVQNATAAGADPMTAHKLGLNAAEQALQDAGFDGYYSPKHPGVRFHFGSEPAVPVGPKPVPDLDWNKPYGPAKADFGFDVPKENLGFDFSPPKDYGDAARADVERRMGGPLPRGQAERRGGEPGGVMPNGSGESAASAEAISRAKSEKTSGVERVKIDTRSGNAVPLVGVDAVDVQPGPYDVILQRTPQGDVELGRGRLARR
jgi:hypothetical protein